jgi:HPt (histidine-containing phosphotransfer) domain-containing protein
MLSAKIANNGTARADKPSGRRIVADNPIDETALDRLRLYQKEGKPDFPLMIVTLYLDTTPPVLKELETASDTRLLCMAAHRLHSASTVVGAVRLSALCNELEAILRTGPAPDAPERVRRIAEEYKRVEAALRSWRTARQGNPKPTVC